MTDGKLDIRDAIVGILVGAARADGRVLRAESQTATLHLEALDDVAPLSTHDFHARFDRLAALYDGMGADAFLARCAAALPPEVRGRVFRATAAVMLADEHVSDAEFAYFRLLARHLGVPQPETLAALRKG